VKKSGKPRKIIKMLIESLHAVALIALGDQFAHVAGLQVVADQLVGADEVQVVEELGRIS